MLGEKLYEYELVSLKGSVVPRDKYEYKAYTEVCDDISRVLKKHDLSPEFPNTRYLGVRVIVTGNNQRYRKLKKTTRREVNTELGKYHLKLKTIRRG